MASVIQCLSQTPSLASYFVSEKYSPHLNKDNFLGYGGKVATEFAKTLALLWSGKYTAVAPVDFKKEMGTVREEFKGYQQHDAHELLTCLLDALHEDVNRVIEKPAYKEEEDNDAATDTQKASLAWETHCGRNQSVIVDLFQGMIRSECCCSICEHRSVRFETLPSGLPLELPEPVNATQQIILSRCTNGGLPPDLSQYRVTIKRTETIAELKLKVAKTSELDAERLCVMQISRHKQPVELSDSDVIDTVLCPEPLWVFELALPRADCILLPVVHRKQKKGNWKRSWEPFGCVQILAVPKENAATMTRATLHKQVSEMALGYLKSEERAKLDQLAGADGAEIQTAVGAAEGVKASGNEFIKSGNYGAAVDQYTVGLSFIRTAGVDLRVADVRKALLLNRAMCYLKLAKYEQAITDASTVLQLDPANLKALARRGQALLKNENFAEAATDIRDALQLCLGDIPEGGGAQERTIANEEMYILQGKHTSNIPPTYLPQF